MCFSLGFNDVFLLVLKLFQKCFIMYILNLLATWGRCRLLSNVSKQKLLKVTGSVQGQFSCTVVEHVLGMQEVSNTIPCKD